MPVEWTTVTVIIALVGLISTVTLPIINLCKTLERLNATMEAVKQEQDEQKKALSAQREESRESHHRLWAHNDEQDNKINNHEARISVLEQQNRSDT